jgi:Domain of unknown function (DUF4190)
MSSQYQYPDPPHQPQPAAIYQPVYVQPVQPKGASITSMVLGLVSILLGFTFLVPVIGFIFGMVGLRKEPAGRGMAAAGLILNGLFLLGWVLLFVFLFGLFGGAATSTTLGA